MKDLIVLKTTPVSETAKRYCLALLTVLTLGLTALSATAVQAQQSETANTPSETAPQNQTPTASEPAPAIEKVAPKPSEASPALTGNS
ncbi:MAG: hypothetical protein R3194_11205, partial [Limnobacter sp.]|nr:hypothetical protein [Limnobacter sp.]